MQLLTGYSIGFVFYKGDGASRGIRVVIGLVH